MGTLLSSSQQIGKILSSNEMKYFYYNIPGIFFVNFLKNIKIANFNETLALRVQKPTNTNLRIYLSLSNFTMITLPTTEYYLGQPLDLSRTETLFYLLIQKWVYRNDNFYGKRQIYFGYFYFFFKSRRKISI